MFAGLRPRVWERLIKAVRSRVGVLLVDCGGRRCRRFTLAHRRLRKDGIFFDDTWLCSARCLEAKLAERLAAPRRAFPSPMPRVPYRLILVRQGLLSQDGLRAAIRYARERGTTLDRALLALGLVTEQALGAVRAAETGCAFYALPPAAVPEAFVLPPALAARYEAAAVHATHSRVLIGFVHGVDRGLLAIVEQITGTRAEGCIVTAAHWREQLGLAATTPCPAAELCRSGAEAVRRVREHAVATGAERLRLGQMNSLVWVRLYDGRGRQQDHLLEFAAHAPLRLHNEAAAAPERARRRG